MIWGEPNRNANFNPEPPNSPIGPRRYALLLNAGYHALKGVSRKNIVIGGNNASYGTVNPQQFLNAMRLPNGKPPPLDYYGLNPYTARPPALHQAVCCKGGRDIDDLPAFETQLKHTYHRLCRCGCLSSRSRRTRTIAPSTSMSRARSRPAG